MLFRSDLSPVQKFSYLLRQISDAVRQTIRHMEIKGVNYDDAILSLQRRYCRPRLVAVQVIDQLTHIRQIAEGDTEALRTLLHEQRTNVRVMERQGMHTKACSLILIPHLETALPPSLRRKWLTLQDSAENEPTIAKFFDLIEDYLRGGEVDRCLSTARLGGGKIFNPNRFVTYEESLRWKRATSSRLIFHWEVFDGNCKFLRIYVPK